MGKNNLVYENVRDVWNYEKFLASQPDVWIQQAKSLNGALSILMEYDLSLFNKTENPPINGFFNANIERMLIGFSLENLVKGILLQNPDEFNERFKKDGNLSWANDGHNLLKLFQLADISLTEDETKFVELWMKCATWAGRYPLPLNEHELPRQRKGSNDRFELLAKAIARIKKAIKQRDILLGADLYDLLHGGIGDLEIRLYRSLYDKCVEILSGDSLI